MRSIAGRPACNAMRSIAGRPTELLAQLTVPIFFLNKLFQNQTLVVFLFELLIPYLNTPRNKLTLVVVCPSLLLLNQYYVLLAYVLSCQSNLHKFFYLFDLIIRKYSKTRTYYSKSLL